MQKQTPQLRFPEFTGEWERKKLGDIILKLDSGVSVNSIDEPIKRNDEYGILKTSSISAGKFHSGQNKKIIIEDILRAKLNPIKDSIIISRMNTPQLVGESGYVDDDYPNLFIPDRLWMTTTDKEHTNTKMLSIILSSEKTMGKISNIATGTSGSMKNISKPNFLNLEILFPSLQEQTKIATFLTAVDEKLTALKQKKILLAQYKKGVMQKIFAQELRFKDEDENDFPDWEEKKLGEVLEQQIREVKKPKEKYLAIGIRSHVKGTFQKPESDPNKIEMDKLFVVKTNDLIVNITFAWEGAIAIVNENDDGGLVSHRFPTYSFNPDLLLTAYFAQVIIDKKFRSILDLISPGGAGRNRVLSKKEFLKIKWNFPSLSEQTKIANFLSAIDEKINHCNHEIAQTETWKKGLLQQLFV